MFSQACIKNSVHRGLGGCLPHCMLGYTPTHPTRHTPRADTPLPYTPPLIDIPPSDGHCSGRYASYWNAFLLFYVVFITARKRSLGQGNIFTPVCPVHGGEYLTRYTPPGTRYTPLPGTPPWTRYTPDRPSTPSDHTPLQRTRYASYWNAGYTPQVNSNFI